MRALLDVNALIACFEIGAPRIRRSRRREPRNPTPRLPRHAPTNDKRPLRHRRASPYIGCMRRFRESIRRSREVRNLTPALQPPPSTRGMIGNERKLKVLPLLATRDEAKSGHHEPALVQCVRVNGVPNETTLPHSSLPARRKSGQIRPNRATVWGCSTPAHS